MRNGDCLNPPKTFATLTVRITEYNQQPWIVCLKLRMPCVTFRSACV